VKRVYLGSSLSQPESSLQLYEAASEGDLVEMMRAIAMGADVNWKNASDNYKTPLHVACAQVKRVYGTSTSHTAPDELHVMRLTGQWTSG
jgi:hypothetical protein